MTSITDPLNRRWALSYDANGNLARISWPVINGATYSINLGYDANHNITSYQDLRGNTSTSAYNAADNSIAWTKDALGNQTTFQYGVDASGAANAMDTTIVDPNGRKTVHAYNAAGQLASVTDALGYKEYYTYDTANNVTQKQDRRGFLWKSTFDGMGNVLTAKDPSSNTTIYTYNAHNMLLTQKWPSGRSLANTYDAADNLTQVQEKDAAGTVKSTTQYTINSYGLVSDKTDANLHKTLYTYNTDGYLASTTTPLGHKTQWTYDALGFQTSRLDAMNRTTTYTPDVWERLVTTTYPDSSTHAFAYDANSNLTGWADPVAGSWSRAYDADNRILNERQSATLFISNTYDAAGQKGLLSTTSDYYGRTISYAYTARNELAGVSEPAGTETYAYDPNGNQSHRYLPNGLRTDQYYNNDNTLHNYYNWNGGSTILTSYGLSYNADHQITGFNEGTSTNTDTAPGPIQTTYGYDAQGHLNSESRTGPSTPFAKTYQFDPAGNRTNITEGYSLTNIYAVTNLTYDNDDALQGSPASGIAFTYNGNGDQIKSVIAGQTTTFGYDYDDQLTSISKSGSTVSYSYDALGRQVSRAMNGVSTNYYLDGDQVLFETQNGTETAAYTWGNGLIRRNGEYPLYDGRGTARQTTNASQTVTASFVPDGFGRTVSTAGSTASPFLSHGAEGYRSDGDGPAALEAYQKVGARYYDACFGRFITRDTVLSEKPYAYCDGDPVNNSDPSGHSALGDWWKKLWESIFGNGSANANVTFTTGSTIYHKDPSTFKKIVTRGADGSVTITSTTTRAGVTITRTGPTLSGTVGIKVGGKTKRIRERESYTEGQ